MAYKEQVFSEGQVLFHTDLNTMSQGIVSKQDKLVSGQNIKTINGESLIGQGNITISSNGETSSNTMIKTEFESLTHYNMQSGYITNKITGELEASTSGSFKDFAVEDTWTLYATGYAPKSTGTSAAVTFFDSEKKILGYEDFGLSSKSYENLLIPSIPAGTTTVRVQTSSTIAIALTRAIDTVVGAVGYSLKPLVEIGVLSNKGDISGIYYNRQYYRTAKYVRPITNSFLLRIFDSCEYKIFEYDNAFSFVTAGEWIPSVVGESINITLSTESKYFKLIFRKSEALEEFSLPHVIVDTVEKEEYFNVKPSGNFQRLVIPVNVVNAASADSEEWTVQDTPEFLPDYGVLMIPDTYSNIGKPTRLIIYCHGAGVAYGSSVSGFPATDCEPEYWLSEGCAVMDIEGNPYDNSNRHGYMPQGIQCYENAYDWIINNYNICRDGVFLGGRSMGGGMTFEILQSAIPVIASCPVAPVANQLWWWNYAPGSYRKFMAQHMGFSEPWPESTGGYLMTTTEYEFLYNNFDKMIKYAPLWRGIENLPDKDTLFEHGRIGAKVEADEGEAEMYSKLRFKVKAPVKIFASYEDKTVPYGRNAVYMYNMLKNAGQICELRLFHSDAPSAHHFEQQDSRAYTEVTTIYGKTMTAPLVYIEMMQFWRRYEKTI